MDIYARKQSDIALVVIDLIMPQMGGERCLEELLKINPPVRVIVSTGHSLDARENLRLGALAWGFVNKPYEVRQMLQPLAELLGPRDLARKPASGSQTLNSARTLHDSGGAEGDG